MVVVLYKGRPNYSVEYGETTKRSVASKGLHTKASWSLYFEDSISLFCSLTRDFNKATPPFKQPYLMVFPASLCESPCCILCYNMLCLTVVRLCTGESEERTSKRTSGIEGRVTCVMHSVFQGEFSNKSSMWEMYLVTTYCHTLLLLYQRVSRLYMYGCHRHTIYAILKQKP